MNKRKYLPGPEIETIERLMKKRDDLQEENKTLRELLEDVRKFLDRIYAEDIISSGDLGEIYKRVEKAAEDD